MKLISLAIIILLASWTQAIVLSSIVTMSLTLFSLSQPAHCFFGIFRRRRPTMPTEVQESPAAPEGPVTFPDANRRGSFFNPFSNLGSQSFFPGFGNPGLGMFGQNRFPQFSQFQPFGQHQQFGQQHQQFGQSRFPHSQNRPPPSMMFPSQDISPVADSEGDRDVRFDDVPPGMNTDEAESFFTLLAETDESKCISRLVCEMGANPESGGEFGQTISDIIGSLNDFPSGSKVSEYNEVLKLGQKGGLSACLSEYSSCDEESYQLVKQAQVENSQE